MPSAPSLSAAGSRPVAVWPVALAGVLLAAACAARFSGLTDLVVWHDEVASLIRVFGYSQADVHAAIFGGALLAPADLLHFQTGDPTLGWPDTLHALTGHPEHAPLYYILVKLAASLAAPLGVSPVAAARGISALSGVLAIGATYWMTRELFGRGPAPWIAALLVASSPMHFLYAQEARQYALWTALVAASSAALVSAMREDRTKGGWLTYGVLVALGLYTHLLFALALAVQGTYALVAGNRRSWRARARPWALATGAASVAFLPWILVILTHKEEAANYTAWMARDIGALRSLEEWGVHLTRLLVDLGPEVPGSWQIALASGLAGALVVYLLRAPRPALWLPLGIAAAYIGVVLGPDLLLGGSRSQHVRYALPAMLAVETMLAWVLGAGLVSHRRILRLGSSAALALALAAGALSIAAIGRADTWWSKVFSAANGEVALMLNRAERPLLVAGDSGVSIGELISIAYRLDPKVRIWADPGKGMPPLSDYTEVVALMPFPALTGRLGPEDRWRPIDGTWQWWRREPAGPSSQESSREPAESVAGQRPGA